VKTQKAPARLSVSGVFRNGRRFAFSHLVDGGTVEEIDERVQMIRKSIFEGVGRKNTYVLGVHVLDLEEVCSASVVRVGFGEKPIRVR
jgi:hypothetical protein